MHLDPRLAHRRKTSRLSAELQVRFGGQRRAICPELLVWPRLFWGGQNPGRDGVGGMVT